ncbi:hypothetical protein AVEN_236268-1 [Araneus ventricosus]|uniref:Uncharacterized protein n=1 Tax=Araneus ventricosus TaxID=182803 RepID=A0A4Y2SB48_ARAVE|nr:hypothetical protein AVEN_236268-1 [Araneus ventricosus]
MKKHEHFGGLTYSRGVSDSALARKTKGIIAVKHICDGILNFCGVDLNSSDQHLGISDSGIQQDNDNGLVESLYSFPTIFQLEFNEQRRSWKLKDQLPYGQRGRYSWYQKN